MYVCRLHTISTTQPCDNPVRILIRISPFADTTDVQESHLLVDHNQALLTVNCSFSLGSRVLGCVLEVNGTSEDGTSMYYITEIDRVNASVSGGHQMSSFVGEFTYSVFDWEEDGTMGSVPALLHVTIIPREPTTIPDTQATTEDSRNGGTGISIGVSTRGKLE